MLEKIDLGVTIDKETYRMEKERLTVRLGELQRTLHDIGIPVLILFEGWDAAGKGTLINELLMPMDPRSFRVHNFKKQENEDEIFRPFLWRYWTKTPEKGQIAIFNRSYYSDLVYRKSIDALNMQGLMKQANEFEQALSDDGMIIFKFFIHISKKEQKRRFNKLLGNDATSWRVTPRDKKENKHYDKLYEKVNRGLELTDNDCAPWVIIEGEQKDYALIKVLSVLETRLEKVIEEVKMAPAVERKPLIHVGDMPFQSKILDGIGLDQVIGEEEYQVQIKECQKKIRLLQYELYRRRIPLIVGFEGWDAGGKGGCIKRLTRNLDPRGYTVYPTASPSDIERRHHYLWRFWRDIPKNGHLGVWDRTWYGRVMVEPIEGFCTQEEFDRSYREINEFEKQLSDWGAIVIKFWLQIDQDEQLRRFTGRAENPDKDWKITDEDWRNRDKWDVYKIAVDEMLLKTSTVNAPWIIVEAQNKYYARIKVLNETIAAIEKRLDN
ncbi:MAG: polyphosphate:AMP phosphotransferase [Acetobacterium sp.]|uniref:polyphosphate:AMP phosphotransferase n=1 Tax=Acetobacterium sp. TaxID=1872094 RepID=UPI0032426608